MNNSKIDHLIAKYLSGESTLQEKKELKLWLNSNDQNKQDLNKIKLAFQLSEGKNSHPRKSANFSKIVERINADDHINSHRIDKAKNRIIRTWISIAAAIAVILSIGSMNYLNTFADQSEKHVASRNVFKSNPAGQKSKVFLPDGSIVWLNSESFISYESEFNDSLRLITLSGEAYFEVMKDPQRPFIVYSGTVSTTALGTAFNVNAFDENNITVSLTSGKINVETKSSQNNNDGIILSPGEGVIYNPTNEIEMKKVIIDPDEVKMWKDGLLQLKNASLNETLLKLERWYGVEIILENEPVDPWNANGLFDNEYLENVLRNLSFSQGFEYEFCGKQVYIKFKRDMPM